MTSPIARLIYISNNTIDGDDATIAKEIDSILDVARKANSAVGITGALMFNNGCFAQVLEGERNYIEETFERIQCDERHSNVVILSFDEVETRGFSSWSMGYVGDDAQVRAKFDSIRSDSGFDTQSIPSDKIFSLLHQNLLEAEDAAAQPVSLH